MRGTNLVTGRLRRWHPRLIAVVLAILLIVVNGVIALAYLHDLRLINLRVDRSLQTMVALGELEELAQSAGQNLRGYRVSGDAQMLASYREAQSELAAQLSRIRGMVSDDGDLLKQLASLATLNERNAKELAAELTSAESPLSNSHLAQRLAERANQMNDIVSDTHVMMTSERRQLHDDLGTIESRDTTRLTIGMVVRTIAIVLVIAVIFMMRSNVQKNEDLASAQSSALRESELRSRHIFEESPLGVLLANRDDQRIVEANPAFCRMLGYTSDQIAELTIADITHIDDRELLNDAARHVVEIRYVTSAAAIAWARVSLTQLSAVGYLQPLLLGLVEDITREKRAEAELRQAQKMEAIGQLTGGIAHDFNNLLGVILGNAEFLSDTVHQHPDQLALVKEIIDSALSGADLTRRLLAFARRQTLQPRRIDLNTYLPNHIAILRRLLGETVHVTMTLTPDLWPTRVDPSQVGDALLNLTINARDAMPLGGRIQISTANVHLGDDPRDPVVAPGDYVVMTVSDTGMGMLPEVLERAAEPFFTTKEPGAGSGLGLAMIFGFAKQSGGHMTIASQHGRGTTVRLYLPRAQGSEADAGDGAPGLPLPRGHETILLVDDSDEMRVIAGRHLDSLGYRVTEAASGPAALTLLRGGQTFDLLFTDIIMPNGMTGYQLAAIARQLRPRLKVLFATGYAGPEMEPAPLGMTLRKPYRKQDLAITVRAVLEG
jgi:PAS domain S-box-containing protein